ncbi:hypothetical protein scyTo_0005366 [Scyliorhinus torazame]|uniref:Uncharacterized protein n=1 Tax=Scyliorhinus torazame TaxID=75743 RepID=A0A401P6X0_SCYTO|nr:hypothetical protein [Scyliorhinus torazame]
MLEDFYSEFFPSPLGRSAAPELRESCGPPLGSQPAAWGEQRAPEQRTDLSGEEPLARGVLVLPGGEGPTTDGGLGGVTVLGLPVGNGEESTGCKREASARAAGKVPRQSPRDASPPRAPSLDLLVPDSDDMEEAEESRSKWEPSRRPPPERGDGAARARWARTSLRAERADDASARLVPAAREAQIHKEDLADMPTPGISQENEVATGDCGFPSSPHSATELQDQVVIDCWLPEE